MGRSKKIQKGGDGKGGDRIGEKEEDAERGRWGKGIRGDGRRCRKGEMGRGGIG